jgi:nitroreductase
MIKGSEVRHADHPVETFFIDRWSPRAMSGEEIPEEELLTLFEASRWAPSSFNNQPWRVLYARRNTEHWPLFLDLLVESNRVWAQRAAALLVFVSKTTFDYNGKPAITHSYDTGTAWGYFALQGYLKGYVVHGMQGFSYDAARTTLGIAEEFQVEAMAAVGRPGDKSTLPEALQEKEMPNDRRKVTDSVCEGLFRLE